jgi:SpoVK/Ycf46/Vps4 family AAA+-type ATPase
LANTAIYDDGVISESDFPGVMKSKYELLNQEGLLHFEYETEKFSDVGGFANLKKWLLQRRDAFNGSTNFDRPKGVLLLGIQGCGKSLAAKSISAAWGLPLLRLDFSALYNKYHGESEKNLRQCLNSAETMAPCVLWIDELEKGLSSSDSDDGISKRLLGTFLTWLAENKSHVFLVATANNIQTLPPELVRKGRMDEIFFVDLPDTETREKILSIHLAKRDFDSGNFDLKLLAKESEGFSGAEIEQVVVSALYAMETKELKTNDLLKAIKATKPLSVVMDKKIAELRAWAQSRTVPAN